MTPKEKAEELVYKYWDIEDIDFLKSKQCALIAVDEIIYELIEVNKRYNITASPFNYYEQVKKEIEKL